jgi:hypothetical protein
MANTIAAVMRHLRNFFERGSIEGEISIRGGVVTPAVSAPYVFISGSTFHDGVKRMSGGSIDGDIHPDETFAGRVWLLYPPDDFIAICDKIEAFEAGSSPGAYTSETLGEYSYTRAVGANGAPIAWEDAFATRLAPFRRMFTEVS